MTMILVFALAAHYFLAPNVFNWGVSHTVANKGSLSIAGVLSNINSFFFEKRLYPGFLGLIGPFEAVAVPAGIFMLIAGIRDQKKRMLLILLGMSAITLIISNNHGHEYRHMLMIPFVAITCGVALNKLSSINADRPLIMMQTVFFVTAAFFITLHTVNPFLGRNHENPENIKKINERLKAGSYMLLHEVQPYGNYPLYLRLKTAYKKNYENGKAAAIAGIYTGKAMKKSFPGADTVYFRFNGAYYSLLIWEEIKEPELIELY